MGVLKISLPIWSFRGGETRKATRLWENCNKFCFSLHLVYSDQRTAWCSQMPVLFIFDCDVKADHDFVAGIFINFLKQCCEFTFRAQWYWNDMEILKIELTLWILFSEDISWKFAREKVALAGSGCGVVTVVYKPVAFQDSAAVTFDHTWPPGLWSLYHRVLQHFKPHWH